MTLSVLFLTSWTNAQKTGPDTLTIYFTGDVMQHQSQLDHAYNSQDRTYDYSRYFQEMLPEIRQAQFAVCNLETTLDYRAYTGYPSFSSPVALATALRDAGFDICLTANNHCLDRGARGLERTIHILDSLRLKHIGTYTDKVERAMQYPFIIEWQKRRIAILCYTYDTNGIPVRQPNIVNLIDTARIRHDILVAHTRGADMILACMHWGTEYRLQPDNSQKALEKWLYDNGVDHIIGGHPHVIQPVSEYRNADGGLEHLTVWSLGNCISGMTAPNTDRGLGITLFLTPTENTLKLAGYTLHGYRTERPDYRVIQNRTSVPEVKSLRSE